MIVIDSGRDGGHSLGEVVPCASNTRTLIFDVAAIIAFLTQQLTLEPGDVIATGTPAGVGLGMKPQVWLQPGDTVRMEIDGIGVLENEVTGHG